MITPRSKIKPAENLLEVLDRLTRLESRLVQLMYFLGANPNGKYDQNKQVNTFKGEENDN